MSRHQSPGRPSLPRQLWGILNRRQRGQAAVLLVAMLVQASFELMGVASIVPFMAVVADPAVIHTNETLAWVYALGGFGSDTAFLTAIGVAVIGLLAMSNGVSALATWATLRFVWNSHHRLADRLLRGYLAQPYSFFVQRNTASLNKNILSEVHTAVNGVLLPALRVVARALVTLALVALLVLVDPLLALIVVVVLGGAYGAIYAIVRRKQARLGQIRVDANRERYKVTGEAFGGIKDVKVFQREPAFASRFSSPSLRFARAATVNATIAALPRYLLETLAFGGIVVIVLHYLRVGQGVAQILPTLSLYAFAGYRLMPALQDLFSALAGLRFNRPALDDITQDLDRFGSDRVVESVPRALPLQEEIRFDRVSFRYPGAAGKALDEASLVVPRKRTIGIVGASGAGKTTLVDLLLGLYEPESGQILIDRHPLAPDTVAAWRRQVGYVPQQIFLCDDALAANIAFGIPTSEIDQVQVERAGRVANIHDFIMTLPDRYQSTVGERGVRLSGGQRQRIGIARALYHDPAVLVFDEATSALDGATEDAVMEAIRELSGDKTIVLVAHRLSTVADCDRIYFLRGGTVEVVDTVDALSESHPPARATVTGSGT